MNLRSLLGIDIGAGSIKLLYGNKHRIKKFGCILTPPNSVEDNKIINMESIYNVIKGFIDDNGIKAKDVSFAINGQDIVIRHVEIPDMKKSNIKQAIDWEIAQNLPEGGKNFYIDYDILNKRVDNKNKSLKVIVVAVPKEKIDKYLELADKLKLNLRAIDITANCVSRVFKGLSNGKEKVKSVGIIDIGSRNTGITILEDGKIFLEREVHFGLERLVREIELRFSDGEGNPYNYLLNTFDFNNSVDELDNRLKRLIDTVFSSFQKAIQFYAIGKIEKNVDKIFIVGGGCVIKDLSQYSDNFFSSKTTIVNAPDSIGSKIKMPDNLDFKYYINALGLLLRED